MPAPIIMTSGSLAVGGVRRGDWEVGGFVEEMWEKCVVRGMREKEGMNGV